jgi:hypothetical protein
VEVLAPVAPTVDVHPSDPADAMHRTRDARQQTTELRGQPGRHLLEVMVGLGDQDRDEWQTARLARRTEPPVRVLPDLLAARNAAVAILATEAPALGLGQDRRVERLRMDLTLEGEELAADDAVDRQPFPDRQALHVPAGSCLAPGHPAVPSVP